MNQAFVPGSGAPLPFDQQMEVEDVLDAAVEWQAGRLPTTQAVKIGTLGSPGRTRLMAIWHTPKADERWYSLQAFVDHLDSMSGTVDTRQGRFDGYEFRQAVRDTAEQLRHGIIWTGVK